MSSLKRISVASLALGLLADPAYAEEVQPLELDAVNVTSDYESPPAPSRAIAPPALPAPPKPTRPCATSRNRSA